MSQKVPPTELITCNLQVVCVGFSRLTGIVTRVCRPSGLSPTRHRKPPHLTSQTTMKNTFQSVVHFDFVFLKSETTARLFADKLKLSSYSVLSNLS